MVVLMRVMLNVIHDAIDHMNFAIVTKDATVTLQQIVVSYHLLIDVHIIIQYIFYYVQLCIHIVDYSVCHYSLTLLFVPIKLLVCSSYICLPYCT